MRRMGGWLLERPIRIVELGSAVVLLSAAALSDNFLGAAVCYSLAALLLILLLRSFLNGERPR